MKRTGGAYHLAKRYGARVALRWLAALISRLRQALARPRVAEVLRGRGGIIPPLSLRLLVAL